MRKLALGKLGWYPEIFYRSTLRDLHDALAGFNELEADRRQLQIMQTRKMIAWLVNIQLPPADRLTEEKIWPLPIDAELKKKETPTHATVTLGKESE